MLFWKVSSKSSESVSIKRFGLAAGGDTFQIQCVGRHPDFRKERGQLIRLKVVNSACVKMVDLMLGGSPL